MKNTIPGLFAALTISAGLLASSAVQAMQIQLFDAMANQDRQDYLNLLVEGAQKVMIDAGQADAAAKMHELFSEIRKGDALSVGEAEFEGNLANARVFDAKRHLSDPKARRLEVEDALVVTLKKHEIALPQTFFAVGGNFKPKYPPPH